MDKEELFKELEGYGIEKRVLEAMRKVDRAGFVPKGMKQQAWENMPLPIGQGQTISQPLMVAVMTEALDVHKGDKVLEVGLGSGYQAAVLEELGAEVIGIERIPELAEMARKNLAGRNIKISVGDGTLGLPEEAPFDRIMATAGAPHLPKALEEQLKMGGKIVMPLGHGYQELIAGTKTEKGMRIEKKGGCAFVPLIGKDGWKE